MDVNYTFSTVSSSNVKTSNDNDNDNDEATMAMETCGSSNSVLRLERRKLPEDYDASKVALRSTAKYKGVVQQQNRHWGAQIYADHRRVWLGTFKSDIEAAMAYDSAALKLRNSDANSHRNFPWTDATIHEPDFQECYTTEAVLNMIRDGSYQHKFRDFLRIRSQMVTNIDITGSKEGRQDKETLNCFTCTQLFQKELTPSDVGKLNRLVIPKKYAVKYLPYIQETEREGEGVEDVELVFYDRVMRQWKFRYCYWRSSQSFVFTRGWSSFVKDKKLKEKDIIVFYTCNVPNNVITLEGSGRKFLMIDIYCFEENSFAITGEVTKIRNENSCKVFGARLDEHEQEEEQEEKMETLQEDEPGNNDTEENRGFMLFGVRIQ